MQKKWDEIFRVHSYEVDFNNKAKLSSIFNFMQEAAVGHAVELHLTYDEMARRGLYWVMAKARIDIVNLPVVEGKIRVETWIKATTRLYFHREFIIYNIHENSHEEISAKASTDWVILDRVNKRIQRTNVLEEFNSVLLDRHAIEEPLGKILAGGDAEPVYEKEVKYSDIDVNRHVNNARYLDFIMDAVPAAFHEDKKVKSLQVNYKHECRLGEKIRVLRKQETPDIFYVEGVIGETGVKAFQARMKLE